MALESAAARPAPLVIRASTGWSALNLAEVWQFRDLLMTLASRDVRLRYKQTALGVIWVVLQPLIAAGIFAFIFGKVAGISGPNGLPLFLFSYTALMAWNLFNNTVQKASACLIGNTNLISKVFFPRLVLPMSTVPSTMLDFVVSMGLMVGLMAWYRVVPGLPLLMLPVLVALLLMIALGIGLWTAALMVSYRDVQYVLPVFTQMLMWVSGVLVPLEKFSGEARTIALLNPVCGLINGFCWSMLGIGSPEWGALAYSACFSIGVLGIGALVFKRMERRFADVI